MRDWKALVGARLAGLRLSEVRRQQIARELAAHLEDEYTALCARMTEEQAYAQTAKLLAQPGRLIHQLEKIEEEPMTQTTRALWIPGVVMLVVYWVLAIAIGVYFSRTGAFIAPWKLAVVALTFVVILGAVGAWWARTNGATRGQRALVSVFPVFMPVAWIFIAGPVYALFTGRPLSFPFQDEVLSGMVKGTLIPAIGLLLGALPFLRNGAPPRNAATS